MRIYSNVFIRGLTFKSRLRKKFLYFFFLAGIVPLILMGLVGVYVVNRTNRIDVAVLETSLAKQQAVAVEKFINDTIGTFQINVGYSAKVPIAGLDQIFLLKGLLDANPALTEVELLCAISPNDDTGNILPCQLGRETTRLLRGQEPIAAKNFSDQLANPQLIDQSLLPNFLIPKDGRDYVGPVYFTLEGPMVTLASPIRNSNGDIIGVLTGEASLKEIQKSLETVELGRTGYLFVVDRRGNIIAHSKKLGIGESTISNRLVLDVLTGKKRTGLARDDLYASQWGERVIGAGQSIPKYSWAVITEWPFLDAQRVVGTMILQIGQFSVVTFLLVLLLASFVAWQLIRPISILKEGANQIGQGKFDHRISLRTGDEIEELGHSLNKMAESLKQLEELHELKLKTQYLAESLAKEKELSKLKDQFITTASHQLYTPLSVIGWTLESIREPKIPRDEFLQGWEAIDQSRQDLLAITSDLLEISEIGFSYQKTKTESVSLETLVRGVLQKFERQLSAKKLKVEMKTLASDTTCMVDRARIEKALEQLLMNAITYSNDGSVIRIGLDGDAAEVRFSMSDQGIGIPDDERSSIFQAFFRAKNAVEKKNVGTGLGLFLVKTIIEGNGGKVGFESEQGKGTTFTFTLPRT